MDCGVGHQHTTHDNGIEDTSKVNNLLFFEREKEINGKVGAIAIKDLKRDQLDSVHITISRPATTKLNHSLSLFIITLLREEEDAIFQEG